MDFQANDFAGAGFMPSPAGGAATTPGADKARGEGGAHTLRAVTIKQLYDATSRQPNADDELIIDGAPIHNLTLVGKVVSVASHAACTDIEISDGSGTAKVKHWADGDDAGAAGRSAGLTPGAYVRVHGNLRAFDGARSLVAYAIRPVTDGNEVTYHLLQAVFQHAHLKATGGDAAAPVGGGSGMKVEAGLGGGAPALAGAAAPAPAAMAADDGGVGADGLTGLQRAAKAAITDLGASSANGASVDAVCAALAPAGHAAAAVRDAVTFLLEEGHLYSTVDENHVKVA